MAMLPTPVASRVDSPDSTAFGSSAPFSLGVEEELVTLGPDWELASEAERVVREAVPYPGRIVAEMFAAMIELNTPVCEGADAAFESLRALRRAVADVHSPVLSAGVHPGAGFGDAQIADAPRYKAISDYLGGIVRTPICGLHVHVGVPDPEAAVRAVNGVRAYVPLLLAISGSSPFWHGHDSGLASARFAILRSYPRFELPPRFSDYEHFRDTADQVCEAAGIDDYTQIWWWARPHPNLGTVEVRIADAQPSLRSTVAIAALVQALVAREVDAASENGQPCDEALAE